MSEIIYQDKYKVTIPKVVDYGCIFQLYFYSFFSPLVTFLIFGVLCYSCAFHSSYLSFLATSTAPMIRLLFVIYFMEREFFPLNQ